MLDGEGVEVSLTGIREPRDRPHARLPRLAAHPRRRPPALPAEKPRQDYADAKTVVGGAIFAGATIWAADRPGRRLLGDHHADQRDGAAGGLQRGQRLAENQRRPAPPPPPAAPAPPARRARSAGVPAPRRSSPGRTRGPAKPCHSGPAQRRRRQQRLVQHERQDQQQRRADEAAPQHDAGGRVGLTGGAHGQEVEPVPERGGGGERVAQVWQGSRRQRSFAPPRPSARRRRSRRPCRARTPAAAAP